MFAKMLDPVVKDYLFHDSPLRKPAARRTLWIIVGVLVVISFFGWRSLILPGETPFVAWSWVPFSIVGSIIGYLILSFLDRERRVWLFHMITIFSVVFLFSPVAGFFNHLTEEPTRLVFVGFVEEFFKILPVLLLAIYVPNLIRTRKDGLVYGAMAGMGFNIAEIGIYVYRALQDQATVQEALITHLTRLGLFGLGGHIIWSAFVGLGIGIAIESNKTGWRKWKTAIFYYLIAAVAHSAYDLIGSGIALLPVYAIMSLFGIIESMDAVEPIPGELGPFNTAMRFGTYVYNIVFLIVLIVQIRRSFATENTIQVEELSTEEPVVMREEELQRLKAEKLFSKRKYKEYPKKVSNKLVLYQNLLAMQKHTAKQEGRAIEEVEPVPALRKAIRSLRSNV